MRKTNVNRLGVRRAKSVVAEAIEPRWLMSTYTVNTLSDAANPGAGLVTLRQAVASANSHAGADTINFSSSVFKAGSQHTIVLTQGEIKFTDTSGLTTVTGPGSGVATIDGNKQSRLLEIAANASVSISGLTLTGGKQTSGDVNNNTFGGAIYNSGNLTVSSSTVSGNSVVASAETQQRYGYYLAGAGYGGGIYSTGSLTVTGSLVANNSVTNTAERTRNNGGDPAVNAGGSFGGGIFASGLLTLTDDSVSSNSVSGTVAVKEAGFDNGGPAAGGGVYGAGVVNVLRSTISGNTATAGYAAAYGGPNGGNAEGGGLFAGGELMLDQSTVSNNHLYAGRSSFDDGYSGYVRGGGVYAGSSLTMTGSTVSGNKAVAGDTDSSNDISAGGGVYAGSSATLSSDQINDNQLVGGPGVGTLLNPQAPGGTTTAGGGVYGGGTLSVTNSSVSGNSVSSEMATYVSQFRAGGTNEGGGIVVTSSSTITGSTVAGNVVSGGQGHDAYSFYETSSGGNGNGGGVYTSATLVITNSTIANNSAVGGKGGTADQMQVGGNGGVGDGGAIFTTAELSVYDSTITGNAALAGKAGDGYYGTNSSYPAGLPGSATAGGIDISAADTQLFNSIVSGDNIGTTPSDINGTVDPNSANNLVGAGGGLDTQKGNRIQFYNPMLAPLANNGGSTLTMLPSQISPALDAGNGNFIPAGVSTDERGFARTSDGAVDIGAVELDHTIIEGKVFNDANGNGVMESSELGRFGVTVYIDANNNGIKDGAEQSFTTDTSGFYSFYLEPPGVYKIRQVLPAGWKQTTPANNFGFTITLGNGTQKSDNNFGEQMTAAAGGAISGTVFNDVNGNGAQNSSETGRGAGITIYNDANNNGKMDSGEVFTTTDANGNYSLTGLPAGNYKIREILPSGWKQTSPTNGFGWTLTLGANQTLTAKNFEEQTTVAPPPTGASISGTIFDDHNGNGKEDSGDAGLSAWTLFIDTNNDGVLDNGELTAMTKADGSYSFVGLAAGTYILRAIRPTGWNQTTPANGFGQHVTVAANQSKTGVLFGEQSVN